jgi:hypothetical protein
MLADRLLSRISDLAFPDVGFSSLTGKEAS